jgi:hypothetical protein
MALSLARALTSTSYISGAGVAALSRELVKTMDLALADALVSPLDEVQRRRDRKRLSGQ